MIMNQGQQQFYQVPPQQQQYGYQGQQMQQQDPLVALYTAVANIVNTDVFIENTTMRDTKLIETVKPYGWEIFGEGQHRVVFRHKAYPGKVFKVAHKLYGRNDNMGEYALSGPAFVAIRPYIAITTQSMYQGSPIDTIANGGILSEQEEVLCIRDYVYNTDGKNNIGYNAMRFMVKYWPNYVDLIGKLSQHVFLFDAHAKNPFNLGLRSDGNNGSTLVFLDVGYFLHNSILQAKGIHDGNGIKCGKCGSYLRYNIPNIYGKNEVDAIKQLTDENSADSTEKYCCENKSCGNVVAAKDLFNIIMSR